MTPAILSLLRVKSPQDFIGIAVIIALLVCASFFAVLRLIHRIYFHPLNKYPGPKLWAATSLPWGFWWLSGRWHHKILELHDEYGHIVRVGPNELSFDVPEAWEDVYGRSKQRQRKENPKPAWYLDPKSDKSIVSAREEDHDRIRRLLSNGFSTSALNDQEPLIKQHVDLLVQRLHEKADHEQAVIDIFQWFASCTFDIMGDLAFGEPFGSLREGRIHAWVAWAFANIKLLHTLTLCKRLTFFYIFLPVLEIFKLYKSHVQFEKSIHETVEKHISVDTKRPDLVQLMGTHKGDLSLSRDEIYANAVFLVMAGAETTSTVLTTVIYFLTQHSRVKNKLATDILNVFSSEAEIDMRSAAKVPYLMAVIEESMRFHPPGPNALWRMTPPEGNEILGQWIPGNTILSLPHRAIYRSERNFRRANEFLPERWMTDPQHSSNKHAPSGSEFANDRRDAFHPFSYGPRSCLAMNMAYAELRLVLARLLYNFDVTLAPQSKSWMHDMKAWLMWEKHPLFVHLQPRVKGSA